MNLTKPLYDKLAADGTLTALLSTYNSLPAIFTMDPVPLQADLPYIITAGHVSDIPFDTKTQNGRQVVRDIRCYAPISGSVVTVEAIAERVRALLHRQPLTIDGTNWIISDCSGPTVADEEDAYGRIVTLNVITLED